MDEVNTPSNGVPSLEKQKQMGNLVLVELGVYFYFDFGIGTLYARS